MSDASIVVALFKEHALCERYQLAVKNQLTTLKNNNHPSIIFVIEIDNSVEGYMSLLTQYSTWNMERYLYLDCLFLRSEYRGLGIGQKLMAMASTYVKELNLSEPSFL